MGYTLWLVPLPEKADPVERMRDLIERSETSEASDGQEATRRRLTDLLMSTEPRLRVFPRDKQALAEALPDLSESQIAYLARTAVLTGWDGVQIEVGDEWVEIEIATWPQLAQPDSVKRLTRLARAVCGETGWSCVDAERGVQLEPEEAVRVAVERAAAWGDAVRAAVASKDKKEAP